MTSLTHEQQKRIDTIMDHFDFACVRQTMLALNWTWRDSPEGVPTESELRQEARRLLRIVATRDDICCTGIGGFNVDRFEDGTLQLSFVVAEWDA